jgi:hypothetical protein
MRRTIVTNLFEDPARPRKPAVVHRPITKNISSNPSQVAGRPRGRKGFTFPAVRGIRPLLLDNCSGVVPLQVERLTKPFQRSPRLSIRESILEGVTSRLAVTSIQCRPASFDHGLAHQT